MSNPDPNTVPTPALIDRARLAELEQRAAAATSGGMSGSESSSAMPLSSMLAAGAPRHLGSPEPVTCPDCGESRERVLERTGSLVLMWVSPPHTCPPREARLAREAAEQEAKYAAWLEEPPRERIAQVRAAARLPCWTPEGLSKLRWEGGAATCLRLHRGLWLAGGRPERGLWVWGPTNRRKTAMLAALVFDVAHRTRRRALYWNFESLMDHYRRGAAGQPSDYDFAELEAADLLVLDDIGSVKVTERAAETLYAITNAAKDSWGREAPRQTLYVASNESPRMLGRLLETPERPEGGARIVGRLTQLCEVREV